MSFALDRNWINSLKVSLPEYATDLGNQIETIMNSNVLSELDAHACALAAAIADSNGELAFEIAMSDVLRGNDVREEIAKATIDLTIDSNMLDHTNLYHLAIAQVLKIEVNDVGVPNDQFVAATTIAKLITAVKKCVI